MKVQNESEGFEESENSFCFLIRLIMVNEVIDGIPPVAFFVSAVSFAGGPLTETGKYSKIPFV